MDLWEVLGKLDRNNPVYDTLSDTDKHQYQKDIQWLIPQWITSSSDEREHKGRIELFNEFCNRGWSHRKNHPRLHDKMISTIGMGKTRHKFYYKKTAVDKLYDVVRIDYPDATIHEIDTYITQIKDLPLHLDRLGFTKDEIKVIMKGRK